MGHWGRYIQQGRPKFTVSDFQRCIHYMILFRSLVFLVLNDRRQFKIIFLTIDIKLINFVSHHVNNWINLNLLMLIIMFKRFHLAILRLFVLFLYNVFNPVELNFDQRTGIVIVVLIQTQRIFILWELSNLYWRGKVFYLKHILF